MQQWTIFFRLLRELVAFEDKYDMASDVFYARFMRGEMGNDLPFIKWAGRYELYLEAKQVVDNRLAKMSEVLREIEQLIFNAE